MGPALRPLGVDQPDGPFPHLNTREDFPRVSEDFHLAEAIEQISSSGDSP